MGCTSDRASRRASEFCGYIVISVVVDDRGIREVVLGDLDGVSGCMDVDVLISFAVFEATFIRDRRVLRRGEGLTVATSSSIGNPPGIVGSGLTSLGFMTLRIALVACRAERR